LFCTDQAPLGGFGLFVTHRFCEYNIVTPSAVQHSSKNEASGFSTKIEKVDQQI